METTVMHPTYLPFTEEQVLARFVDVVGPGAADAREQVRYYETALDEHRRAAALASLPQQRGAAATPALARDERFWTATALLSVFHGPSPVEDLVGLLTRAYGEVPPFAGFATWAEALGSDPELFLEVGLPSPSSYQHHLRRELPRHVLSYADVRNGRDTVSLEGATSVDAVVVSPTTGVAVVVTAKVGTDVATSTAYDVRRNELARVVDVTLDAQRGHAQPALRQRRPDRTCVLLLTPEVFREDTASRLYGHLFSSYTGDPATLGAHLPHRSGPVVREAARRLGWATWEDVERVRPGALPWRVPGAR